MSCRKRPRNRFLPAIRLPYCCWLTWGIETGDVWRRLLDSFLAECRSAARLHLTFRHRRRDDRFAWISPIGPGPIR